MSIIEYLNSKKQNPVDVYPKLSQGISFLDTYFDDFKDHMRIMYETSVRELCLVYFTCISPKNYRNIITFLNTYSEIFDFENLDLLIPLIITCTEEDIIDAYFNDELDSMNFKNLVYDLFTRYDLSMKCYSKFIVRFTSHLKEVETFIKVFKKLAFTSKNAAELVDILSTFGELKMMRSECEDNDEFYITLADDTEQLRYILDSCAHFKERYSISRKKYAEKVREINRHNNTIQKTIDIILRYPFYLRPEALESILCLNLDDEVKNAVLDYIYDLNSKEENKITTSHDDFKIGTRNALKDILKIYDLNIYDLTPQEVDALCQMNNLSLRGILDFFSKYNISLPNIICVASYDLNAIQKIESLLQNGILTTSFVGHNLQILEIGSSSYKTLMANIALLAANDINIKNYSEYLDILLTDLTTSIALLQKYGININSKTKNISFLVDPMLERKLDLLIEWGVDIALITSYDELNDSYETLLLKYLSSSLGFNYSIELYAGCSLSDLMPNSNALVPDEFVAKFNENKNYSVLPQSLREYMINPNAIFFNGVYMSIHRVSKNISCIDQNDSEQLFYALIYNGYYNLNQINLIKEEIDKAFHRA